MRRGASEYKHIFGVVYIMFPRAVADNCWDIGNKQAHSMFYEDGLSLFRVLHQKDQAVYECANCRELRLKYYYHLAPSRE